MRKCLDGLMTLAQRHRQALCEAASAAGPDAPTLCEGWDVRDLLIHLVVRDARPDVAIAMVVSPLSSHADNVQATLAALPFGELVDRVRSGPPRWSPAAAAPIDGAMNVAEFLIHTEDIVRATGEHGEAVSSTGRGASNSQTPYADDTVEAAWTLLRRAGRLFYRASPTGVVAVANGVGRAALRRPPKGRGSIILQGAPVELLLHAFGRRDHCAVDVIGDASEVTAFRTALESA